jgi:Glutaminase
VREPRELDTPAASQKRCRALIGAALALVLTAAIAASALSKTPRTSPRESLGSSSQTDLQALLERVHRDCTPLDGGAVADYIPALREADPSRFGIAIVTVDGRLFSVGDAEVPFALMSAAKPFTAALALRSSAAKR